MALWRNQSTMTWENTFLKVFNLSTQSCLWGQMRPYNHVHAIYSPDFYHLSGLRLEMVNGKLWCCLSKAEQGLDQQQKVCSYPEGALSSRPIQTEAPNCEENGSKEWQGICLRIQWSQENTVTWFWICGVGYVIILARDHICTENFSNITCIATLPNAKLDMRLQLRIYPRGFADYLKDLYPGLVTGGEGMPRVYESESAEAVFEKLPFSTWSEANLIPCLRYLRGNKYLKAPPSWVAVFPTAFEILHRREQRAS